MLLARNRVESAIIEISDLESSSMAFYTPSAHCKIYCIQSFKVRSLVI